MDTARHKKHSLKRKLKRIFAKPLLKIAYVLIPRLYYLYMTLIWHTSKIEYYGMEKIVRGRKKHGSCLCALWHENVFFVAYCFREFAASTLASVGDLGEVITRMLKMCNFEVFRGGSSKGKSRKKRILPEMIEHMKQHHNILYGITVDGSSGPPYVAKTGVLAIAKEIGSPVYVVHVLSKPTVRMLSWDRTRIAFPFSRIIVFVEGPYFCPSDATLEHIKELQAFLTDAMMDNMRRCEHYLKTKEILPPSEPFKPTQEYVESEMRRGRTILEPGEYCTPSLRQSQK